MSTSNTIDNFINAILNLNADAVSEFLAEDVVFYDPMGNHSGRKNVYDMFKGFFEAAEKIEWDIRNKIIEGNSAVIERVNHIKLKGGQSIDLPIVTVAELADDKIKVVRDYFDSKTFNDQLA